jgi:hypothetical protein
MTSVKKLTLIKATQSIRRALTCGLLLACGSAGADPIPSDPTLFIDGPGRLIYRDPKPKEFAGTAVDRGVRKATAQSDPGDVFALHSRPTSKKTIYLNFKGGTLTLPGGRFYSYPVFDLDGDPSTFSVVERSMILEVFQRVSEDFAPFDVDVTTEAPARDGLARSSKEDDVFGQQIFITRDVDKTGLGGMAPIGSFDSIEIPGDPSTSDYYRAAFAYYDNVTPMNPGDRAAAIADVVSHELGHTLGLHHMGEALPNGTVFEMASGDWMSGWVPLMGNNGFFRRLSTWTKGDYENSNNHEDELAIMQSHGLAFVDDDYGSTMDSAFALKDDIVANGMTTVTASGIISTPDNIDYFKITIPAGPLSVVVDPAPVGPNLDVKLAIYDSNGKLVQSVKDKPTREDSLGAAINLQQLAGGTYFIRVEGTGRGSPVTMDPEVGRPWGYTPYGSLGRYSLTAKHLAPPTESSIRLDLQYQITGRLEEDGYHAPVTLDWWPSYYGYYPAELAGRNIALDIISDFGNGFVKTASIPWMVDQRKGYAQALNAGAYRVVYDKAGSYIVSALGVDKFGTSASQTKSITVLPPLPPTLKRFNASVGSRGLPLYHQELTNPNAIMATRPPEYGFTDITINVDGFDHVVTGPGYGIQSSILQCEGHLPITGSSVNCHYDTPGDYTITIKVVQEGIEGATTYTTPIHIL